MEDPGLKEEIIQPRDPQKTLEWIAVLAAAGIDYRLSQESGVWTIHVASETAAIARAEIDEFEKVNADWPPKPLEDKRNLTLYRNSAALYAVWLILAVYAWLGPYDVGMPACAAAAADSGRILAGEWWRVVTCLTLHADVEHLLMNVFFLFILGHAVCSAFGGGLGLFLVLMSGVTGNAAVAVLVQPVYTSVGASTACFGALGIIMTYQIHANYLHFRDWKSVWDRVWIPLGAGMALLAITGTGLRSDLAAHALGLVAGILLSIPVSITGTKKISGTAQGFFAGAALATVLLGWWMAFASL